MMDEGKIICPCCGSEKYIATDFYNPIYDKRYYVNKCEECGYIKCEACDAYANVVSREEHYPNNDEFVIRFPITINNIRYEAKYELIDRLGNM